jgi:hypothetical protein
MGLFVGLAVAIIYFLIRAFKRRSGPLGRWPRHEGQAVRRFQRLLATALTRRKPVALYDHGTARTISACDLRPS